MKQTLLTLTLALSSFVAMGQTKIDSAIVHDPKWQGIQSTANSHEPFEGIINGGTIRKDTIKCHFKELVISNDTIIEKWRKGWACREIWRSIDPCFYTPCLEEIPTIQNYLYSDRKTKVTNQVIYSINSK